MPVAALYTRVSSAGQVRDGYSLEVQREALEEYCRKEGLRVHRVYEEAGRSGSTTHQREALLELIADAHQRRFDTVLIFRVDRFSREPADLLRLVSELNSLGIKLRSVTEYIDANDPAGELTLTILGAIAKYVRHIILQGTWQGKLKRAKEGRFTGGSAPFGYVAVDGVYQPDTRIWWEGRTAAEVARMMFRLYVDSAATGEPWSARDVAGKLIELGVPAPRTRWNAATIGQILRNPAYIGEFTYNKRSHQLYKPSAIQPRDRWIVVPDAHPALISREVWDRAQEIRADNRRGGRPAKDGHPDLLNGFVRCSECGSVLTPRRTGKPHCSGKPSGVLYYTCASRFNDARRRDGKVCRFPSLRASDLETLVWDFVSRLATEPKTINRLTESQSRDLRSRLAQAEKDLAETRKTLREIEAQQVTLTEKWTAGTLLEHLYDAQVARLENRRRDCLSRIHELAARSDELRQEPAPKTDAGAIREHLSHLFREGMMIQEKRTALALVIGPGGIRVSPEGQITVEIQVGGGDSSGINHPSRQDGNAHQERDDGAGRLHRRGVLRV